MDWNFSILVSLVAFSLVGLSACEAKNTDPAYEAGHTDVAQDRGSVVPDGSNNDSGNPDRNSSADIVLDDSGVNPSDVNAADDTGSMLVDGNIFPDANGDPGGAKLVIEQIKLEGFMGEAALVIGPDGTSVLIDTGNDSHDAQVRAAVERQTGQTQLDWVILTHYHADHIGGIEDLLTGSNALTVSGGIVTRGLVDVGDTSEENDFQEMCSLLTEPAWQERHFELCEGTSLPGCDGDTTGQPWPASGCSGLYLGDLTDPSDDNQGMLTYIPLGLGARLVFFHANGYLASQSGAIYAGDHGISMGHGATAFENGRSLGALVSWGEFRHTFHGDLTAEVDAFYASRSDEIVTHLGGPPLIGPGGLDTTHASHHGLSSGTSQALVDWLLPADGQSHNVIVGTNRGYWLSPSNGMMSRVGPSLGGGFIWTTMLGTMPGSHADLRVADGSVVIRVLDGGDRYQVYALTQGGPEQLEEFTSTMP